MSIWSWVYAFRDAAQRSGDPARAALFDRLYHAMSEMHADPEQALRLLEQARAAAHHLAEPRWELLFEHWILQTLLFYKRDHREALGRAVQATVRARQSALGDFPQRICLHEDLIYAYVGIDPFGHAGLIEQALAYMEAEIHPRLECYHCLLELRARFELERGQVEAAQETSLRYLSIGREPLHLAVAHLLLCRIAYQRQAWNDLLEWSTAGAAYSHGSGPSASDQVELLAWQALALQRAGAPDDARQLYQRVIGRVARLKEALPAPYYDALSRYLEGTGALDRALQMRAQQIVAMESQGQLLSNIRARLDQCRLLAALGRPLEDRLAAARDTARQLADPTPFLEQLAIIERAASTEPGKGEEGI